MGLYILSGGEGRDSKKGKRPGLGQEAPIFPSRKKGNRPMRFGDRRSFGGSSVDHKILVAKKERWCRSNCVEANTNKKNKEQEGEASPTSQQPQRY